MKQITLGTTGIAAPQNGFGCLPIQRDSTDLAVKLLQKAYKSGVKFFDTARAYTDSEEKVGIAFKGVDRNSFYLTTKTRATNVEDFWKDLNTSLKNLQMDYVDVYQFHQADQCYKPNDGTGMYEAMLEAKQKGLIKHIGITTHKCKVALEAAKSGLYETLQYPLSYLATDVDLEIVKACKENNVGFIAMKGLSGGVLTNSKACYAFLSQFDNVMPIWGIQKEEELDEWLSYMENTPVYDDEIKEFIEKDKKEFSGDFCRGCGYCEPCAVGIKIHDAARVSQLIRRSPTTYWKSKEWQKEMDKIDACINCGLCKSRCPYGLNTPELLKKNLIDYRKIMSGEIDVENRK